MSTGGTMLDTSPEPPASLPAPGVTASPGTDNRLPSSISHLLVWWLVPVIVLGWALWAGYGAITHERYSRANGVAGELLAGHTVGQSFTARYPDLSGIELSIGTYGRGADPHRSKLVLHLRQAPPGQSPTPDLATVELPPDRDMGENPWYLFSFSPVHDSQDKTFYLEVESPDGQPGRSLTIFWWQPAPNGVGDPYGGGTSYLDGKAQRGDLAFGLLYSPSPLAAYAQAARAASANLPPALILVLALAAILGAALAIWRLPSILRDPSRRANWLVRWSLPLVLAIALANGLVYMLLVPPWQGPDEHAHFAYAALLDRYNLDDGAVNAADASGTDRDEAWIAKINESMDRNHTSRLIAWHPAPGASVDAGYTLFWELYQPPAYYWLCAVALRGARVIGLPADPFTNPEAALRVMRFGSLMLGLCVVALAWVAGVLLSPRVRRWPGNGYDAPPGGGVRALWLRLLLPLSVALFPMHAFIATVVNDDILAELDVSALFVVLLALLRWPVGLKSLGLAALAVALTVAGAATKSSALSASVPLLGLGLLVWLGLLAWRTLRGRLGHRRPGLPVAVAVVLLLAGGVLALSAFAPANTAAGWELSETPITRASRVQTTTAHEGQYVIELHPAQGEALASQVIFPLQYHPAMSITVSGWARLAPGSTSQGMASITIHDAGRIAGQAQASLARAGEWVRLSMSGSILAGSRLVTVALGAGSGTEPVQFDDFSLQLTNGPPGWHDPMLLFGLRNPSAETAAVELRPLIKRFLPQEAQQMADIVFNPQPFDKAEVVKYYADAQYQSFWGNFGWLSLPLPDALYTLLGLLILVALAGLAWLGVRALGRWGFAEWLALISLLVLVADIAVSFAKQMMLFAQGYLPSFPQGRYLFVLIVPIAWLLIAGAWGAWSLVIGLAARLLSRRQPGQAPAAASPATAWAGSLPWPAWLWLNGLLLFAAYTLLALIVPFYYG